MDDVRLLQAFLPSELTGGFFKDLIVGRVKEYLLGEWVDLRDAWVKGDLTKLETYLDQISAVISSATAGRLTTKNISAWLLASASLAMDWADNGTVKTTATAGDEFTAFEDACVKPMAAQFSSASPTPDVPKPEFVMEAVAIIGVVLRIVQYIRDRRKGN